MANKYFIRKDRAYHYLYENLKTVYLRVPPSILKMLKINSLKKLTSIDTKLTTLNNSSEITTAHLSQDEKLNFFYTCQVTKNLLIKASNDWSSFSNYVDPFDCFSTPNDKQQNCKTLNSTQKEIQEIVNLPKVRFPCLQESIQNGSFHDVIIHHDDEKRHKIYIEKIEKHKKDPYWEKEEFPGLRSFLDSYEDPTAIAKN